MQELEKVARKHADEYFRVNNTTSVVSMSHEEHKTLREQIVEMFKILIVPEKTLKAYFESLGNENLKKEFKRIAIMIHPDKNGHQNSKIAFQKLYNNFVGVFCPNN